MDASPAAPDGSPAGPGGFMSAPVSSSHPNATPRRQS